MTNIEAARILDRLLNDEQTYKQTLTDDCLKALWIAINTLEKMEKYEIQNKTM